jgi:hypothetical protein
MSQRRTRRLSVLSTRHARRCTEQHQLQQQQCRYGQRTSRNRPPPLFPVPIPSKLLLSSVLTSLGTQYSFSVSGEIRALLLNVRPPFTSRYFSNPSHSFVLRFPLGGCQQQLSCSGVLIQQGADAML